jgi:hypothetical protein
MRFLNPYDKTAAMDYGSALASAVAWLGNRYLLASPARRLTHLERCSANLTAPSIPRRSLSDNEGNNNRVRSEAIVTPTQNARSRSHASLALCRTDSQRMRSTHGWLHGDPECD